MRTVIPVCSVLRYVALLWRCSLSWIVIRGNVYRSHVGCILLYVDTQNSTPQLVIFVSAEHGLPIYRYAFPMFIQLDAPTVSHLMVLVL